MNKILYVSAEHQGEYPNISISSPKALDKELADGWTILKSKKEKVAVADGCKKIAVERYDLAKVDERGVSVRKDEDEPEDRGLRLHQPANRSVIPGQNNESYLGTSLIGQVPGVRAISASLPSMAFGVGVDAAKTGAVESDCTRFAPGSKPWAEWLQGFWKAEGKMSKEAAKAATAGKHAADGPKDAEVTCPYSPNEVEFQAWLYGFKLAGGRVEAG